jgi:single-strand DNA-binding protein
MQMNRVVIAGYVSKPAEVKHLPSGAPVAKVRVGESVRHTDGGGESREHTNWHSLSFYGKLADVAQALRKGDNIYVDGRIEQRQFIARDGGKPRTDARDRSEPVSRNRARPTREQRGEIGCRKRRCQWISEYGRRG